MLCALNGRLDVAVRMERSIRDPLPKGKHAHHAFRPESPPWVVDHDSVSVATPSGRKVSQNLYRPDADARLAHVVTGRKCLHDIGFTSSQACYGSVQGDFSAIVKPGM